MKLELKDFQETAARKLLRDLDFSRREAKSGQPQALILSSPTGSGKTVTVAALMERVLEGYEGRAAIPNASFLWISDSPELNQQSRDKLLRASTALRASRLVIIDSTFDQEQFLPGHIYFLNTQKLGREKLLTVLGDGRSHTVWQTVSNTVKNRPDEFFLVIDEAHRGMDASAIEQQKAQTIVQKFLIGDPETGMPPIPIVIGMSATAKRFQDLIHGIARTARPTEIRPDDVRSSGLLKDRVVVYHPAQQKPGDMTLLEDAARQWKGYCSQWDAYCTKEKEAFSVRPLLVVQVEDGAKGSITRTNLDDVITVIERTVGPLSDEDYAHAFDTTEPIVAGGHRIRKVDASRIQDEFFVNIIFFKMALSTGWDCPRAEVMMSFRRAVDPTSIAQLVGRMVRSPLARRIESNDLLNSVALYLPHYDRKGLERILSYLRDPNSQDAFPSNVVAGEDLLTYPKAPGTENAFKALAALPSYTIEHGPKLSDAKRLMMLGRYLTTINSIDPDALDDARETIIDILSTERALLYSTPAGASQVRDCGEIRIKEVSVESGIYEVRGEDDRKLQATPENIDEIFEECDTTLAPKEGIHTAFWKKFCDPIAPHIAKLELVVILQKPDVWHAIEEACFKAFNIIYSRNQKAITSLPASQRERYRRLQAVAKAPQPFPITYPDIIQVSRKTGEWKKHLYVDESGNFYEEFNSWEDNVLRQEISHPDFRFWLRNTDRKDWALNIPYNMGGQWKGFYPDFLVIREEARQLKIDILEPHDNTRTDSLPKAQALSHYAEQHGKSFGRILLIKFAGQKRLEINLNDPKQRKKVIAAAAPADLDALF